MSFLNNRDRSSYLDVLKPDLGYSVEYILGTTYSLELDTILMSSLSLCLSHSEDISLQIADPIALLEGCRRLSEKSIILFESGQIHQPKKYNQLYYFIEQSLYSAKTPKGGVFHPKVWFVKYKNDNNETKYRFICLSRNITFDTSWDFAFVVNGDEGSVQSEEGRQLSRFFGELQPENLKVDQKKIYAEALEDIKRVHFDVPNKMEMSFHPLGLKKSDIPFNASEYDKQCIVSPFLRSKFSKNQLAKENILISSSFEIHKMEQESKKQFKEILVINDALFDFKTNENESIKELDDVGSDLHAKMYFLEKGKNTELFLGSANATDAAFNQNVEFLLRLKGKTEQIGIDQFLNSDEDFGFRTILKDYENGSLSEKELNQMDFDEQIFKIKKALFTSVLKYEFSEDNENFKIALNFSPSPEWQKLIKAQDFVVKVNLLSNPSKTLDLTNETAFTGLVLGELTSLFCFSVTIAGFEQAPVTFTQKIDGPEFPKKRSDHVIRSSIDSMDKFIRFLYLILHGGEVTVDALSGVLDKGSQKGQGNSYLQIPLFEEILKSLARTPDKLIYIDKVIDGLKDADQKVIPDSFLALWGNVKRARESLNV
nr:phospholipase D family protein [Bdellovibrio sp. HM001]